MHDGSLQQSHDILCLPPFRTCLLHPAASTQRVLQKKRKEKKLFNYKQSFEVGHYGGTRHAVNP